MKDAIIIGFDSAWTDKNKGAICAVSFDKGGSYKFHDPEQVSFPEATSYIADRTQDFSLLLVAIDQPTIVPNQDGCRPVDRIAASLISYVGGGVQPANRSKSTMFGSDAPIWAFKSVLNAKDDPDGARRASDGRFLLEVFPALALTAWRRSFAERLGAPKYNPANRRRFRIEDWLAVNSTIEQTATKLGLHAVADWALASAQIGKPRKGDQDKLDSVICLLAGLIWKASDPSESLLVGNAKTGFIVTPVSRETRRKLTEASERCRFLNGV